MKVVGRVQDAMEAALKLSNTLLNASFMSITCGCTASAELSKAEKGEEVARAVWSDVARKRLEGGESRRRGRAEL